jgi:hypothetical protein
VEFISPTQFNIFYILASSFYLPAPILEVEMPRAKRREEVRKRREK